MTYVRDWISADETGRSKSSRSYRTSKKDWQRGLPLLHLKLITCTVERLKWDERDRGNLPRETFISNGSVADEPHSSGLPCEPLHLLRVRVATRTPR